MSQKDNILQELTELKSTLINASQQNVYAVPDGYFHGLAAQILNRIKAMEANAGEELNYLSPSLKNISKKAPYSVPADYFETLAEKTMQAILNGSDNQTADKELETLSPLLKGLKKEMPYSIPQGYFENLSNKITAEENKQVAKNISITQRKWFRLAAAAIITGIIATTGFLYSGKNAGEKETGVKALAQFTSDVKKMDETQKDDLIDFIDGGLNGEETAQVNAKVKTDEVKKLLEGVSDEELKNFEEQTEDIEDVLMTN